MNTLEDKLKATVMAAAVIEEEKQSGWNAQSVLRPVLATATVAIVACCLIFQPRVKDSFDNPEQALAEVERVFGYISEKIESGTDIALQASDPIEIVKQFYE